MENDEVELEALRKEDFSWHPCQLSLNRSPSGVSLIVECEGNNRIILHKEEALKYLRVRSFHLQDDDCFKIKQGDHILASQDSQAKNLFFDAVVEKVLNVRHSKRIQYCRCTFMVKWIHRDFKEAFVVPSSSIMKLSTKSMNAHSTVSKFLSMVKNVNSEMDLKESLGKQIDEVISWVHGSKKKIDTKGQVPQSPLKRSTRSKNNPPTEIEVRDPPPFPPSIKEDFLENRSPLNPLAACAALASLISKLPWNLECSSRNEEQKCFNYSSNIKAQKEVNIRYVVNNSSTINKFCAKMEHGSGTFGLKNETIVKSLFCASIKKVDSEEMKLSCGSKRRLTRSSACKEEETQANGCTKEMSEYDSSDRNHDTEKMRKTEKNVEGSKKNSSDKRRLTRSSRCLETGNNVTSEVMERLGENKVNENVILDLYLSGEKKSIITPLSEESNLPATEEMNKKRKTANGGSIKSGEVVKRKSTRSTKLAMSSSP